MSGKTLDILNQLKALTLVETSELVKQIETTFNVDASPRQWLNQIEKPDENSNQVAVQTEFDVVLESVPAEHKIAVLKVVRTLTGLGLKEAKDFVESVPKLVQGAIALSEAENLKQQLEAAGAKVALQ